MEKEKSLLSVYCEKCMEDVFYEVEDDETSILIVCKKCGKEMAEVWCKSCEMGGPFVKNLKSRPSSCNCPDCNQKIYLKESFYKKPVMAYGVENAPEHIRKQINTWGHWWRTSIIPSILIGLAVLTVIYSLLYGVLKFFGKV